MENQFNQFLAKYNGTFVEVVDPSNYAQCFDLAIKWCEWLGLPTNIFFGLMYAYQIFTSPTSVTQTNFDFIKNTPDGVPQAGDIVVWGKSYNGTAGHVGIATGMGDVNHFQCFEQNDPTGSNSHLKDYNYTAVLGWLRFKGQVTNSTISMSEQDKKDIESMKKLRAYNGVWYESQNVINDFETLKMEKAEQAEGFTQNFMALEAITADQKGQIEKLQLEISKALAEGKVDCQPYVERFRGKSWAEKLKACVDIIFA